MGEPSGHDEAFNSRHLDVVLKVETQSCTKVAKDLTKGVAIQTKRTDGVSAKGRQM